MTRRDVLGQSSVAALIPLALRDAADRDTSKAPQATT
jgi:hypothetical protein